MSVDGSWHVQLKTPMGAQEGIMELTTDGQKVNGRLRSSQANAEFTEGALDGDTLTWEAKVKRPMPMTLRCDATVAGDSMSGTMKLGKFGTATFEASRTLGEAQ